MSQTPGYSVKRFLVILAGCLLGMTTHQSAQGSANGPNPDPSVQELTLPNFQMETLDQDLPIKDVKISPDMTKIWMLGKSKLWQWDISTSTLKRIQLGTSDSPSMFSEIEPIEAQRLLVIGLNTLLDLSVSPQHVYRYQLPSPGKMVGHRMVGHKFWWLMQNTINVVDLAQQSIKTFAAPSEMKETERVWIDPDKMQLWLLSGNNLLIQKFSPQKNWTKPVTIHQAKNMVLDLQGNGDDLFLNTHRNVLVLDTSSKGKTIIPVNPSLKLSAMHVDKTTHAYLFGNGKLELYDVAQRNKKEYHLEINENENIQKLTVRAPLIAVIVDDRPQLFWLKNLEE